MGSVLQVNPEDEKVEIPELNLARYKHAVKVYENKIWVVAGFNRIMNKWLTSIEVMDLSAESYSWKEMAPLKRGFFNGNIQFSGSIMYAFGFGQEDSIQYPKQLEAYNIVSESTEFYLADAFEGSNQMPVSYVTENELVVFGGYDRKTDIDSEEICSFQGLDVNGCRGVNDTTIPSDIVGAALLHVNFEI